jgi:hypothetical protein
MTAMGMRRVALVGLVAITIGIGPATAGYAVRRAAASDPVLNASPNTMLVDGQAVTVTALGYPLNHSLDLVQCVQDQGCDFSNLQVLFSGDTGGYTTTFAVRRIMQLDGGVQVDCAALQNCVLVSLDITDLSTGAQTGIGFDPNAPFQPPLRFRIVPDATGRVQVAKGVARITGTVHCNQPVDIGADMLLEQIWHGQIFTSEAFTDIACDHAGRFSVVFRPFNGLFGAGAANVRIRAFGDTTSSYSLQKHAQITLVPSS